MNFSEHLETQTQEEELWDLDSELRIVSTYAMRELDEVKAVFLALGGSEPADLCVLEEKDLTKHFRVPLLKARALVAKWSVKRPRAIKYANNVPSEVLKNVFSDPYTQAPRKWWEDQAKMLITNGYDPKKVHLALSATIKGNYQELAKQIGIAPSVEKAKEMFLKAAYPKNAKRLARQKLQAMVSTDYPTVEEFCETYRDTAELAQKDFGAQETVDDFFAALRGKDEERLEPYQENAKTLYEACELLQEHAAYTRRAALQNLASKKRKSSSQEKPERTTPEKTTSDKKKKTWVAPQTGPAENVTCFKCREIGHYAKDCKSEQAPAE